MIGQAKNLKENSLLDWEPVELNQNGCNLFIFSGSGDKTASSSVLDAL